jgi:hypothetical protein
LGGGNKTTISKMRGLYFEKICPTCYEKVLGILQQALPSWLHRVGERNAAGNL